MLWFGIGRCTISGKKKTLTLNALIGQLERSIQQSLYNVSEEYITPNKLRLRPHSFATITFQTNSLPTYSRFS